MHKNICFTGFKRLCSTQNVIKTKICIVGAGPAGFYAAQHLSKKLGQSEIDLFERLPVPFGLVRFGVAPDHPDVKNVISTFTKTANNPNVRFFGNVNLGTDISLNDLRQAYHIVLLTYGAEENRSLGIPGENLENVIPARKVVGWYNGLPWDKDLKIDLNGEVAAIFGQGNVAIDVARILLTPVDELKKTDITQYALDHIAQSKLKKIYLVGRRGPIQAAFTIKELREMLKLRGCSTVWNKEDLVGVSEHIPKLSRPKKRITELMLSSAEQKTDVPDNSKIFKPVFLRSPLEILGKKTVEKVTLGVNRLEGDDVLRQRAILTDQRESLECDLAISSIGYKSRPADPSLPFDAVRGVVRNVNSKVDKGLYVSGWLGTGPTGVIVSTMSNAFTVADTIIQDLGRDQIIEENKPGYENIEKILSSKNIQIVDWKGWEKIDKFEIRKGEKLGKPREKVVDIKEMLNIASQ